MENFSEQIVINKESVAQIIRRWFVRVSGSILVSGLLFLLYLLYTGNFGDIYLISFLFIVLLMVLIGLFCISLFVYDHFNQHSVKDTPRKLLVIVAVSLIVLDVVFLGYSVMLNEKRYQAAQERDKNWDKHLAVVSACTNSKDLTRCSGVIQECREDLTKCSSLDLRELQGWDTYVFLTSMCAEQPVKCSGVTGAVKACLENETECSNLKYDEIAKLRF